MRILFVGDIFGNAGRKVLARHLSQYKSDYSIDVCIANGENAAGGRGMTSNLLKKLRKYGVNVVTGGNHSFAFPDSDSRFMDSDDILRPHNYPPGNVGKGFTIFQLEDGRKLGVLNLMGRTFLNEALDCPFRTGLQAIEELRKTTPLIFVDFHAEASSEKLAFARYIDGKVGAVVGTHTHVQTADEKILPNGTAFITDVGMTGPEDSVIGMKTKQVIKKFLLQSYVRYEPSESEPMLNAVVIEIDDTSGKAVSIERIYKRIIFENVSVSDSE